MVFVRKILRWFRFDWVVGLWIFCLGFVLVWCLCVVVCVSDLMMIGVCVYDV